MLLHEEGGSLGAGLIFRPSGTLVLGKDLKANSLIGVLGRGGSGKSHLAQQLLLDPLFGPDEVLILMAEDSTTSYMVEGAWIKRLKRLADLDVVTAELIDAHQKGLRLPKVIFVDSISGIMDYERRGFNVTPVLAGGSRDKRAEFGLMGYGGMDALINLRDAINADVVVTATTYETGGSLPEFAVEGKLLPKNFVRLTNLCLHLLTESGSFDPKSQKVKAHPWRVIDEDAGIYIDRRLNTQDSGEVLGKGHSALRIREWAYLPDIIRLIHGEKPVYLHQET
jgi:hypothetical protein